MRGLVKRVMCMYARIEMRRASILYTHIAGEKQTSLIDARAKVVLFAGKPHLSDRLIDLPPCYVNRLTTAPHSLNIHAACA